jgi:hypothetical protein
MDDAEPVQVHEGFSEALGLPLQTMNGNQTKLKFAPIRTRYYQTDTAHPGKCAGEEED